MKKTTPALLVAVRARFLFLAHSDCDRTRRVQLAAATFLFLAGLFLATCPSRAAVTPVAWYRLGENDPGAVNDAAPLRPGTSSATEP